MLRRCPASPRTYAPRANAAPRPCVPRTAPHAPLVRSVVPMQIPTLVPRMGMAKKAIKKASSDDSAKASKPATKDKSSDTVTKSSLSADDTPRSKALAEVLKEIESSYGKGSMIRLGKTAGTVTCEVIPSGSMALDAALGVGGLPRGRVTEIFGPESSGKTTLALHVIAAAQKVGGSATFIDAEHALDPVYAAKLGVDTESLFVNQPDTGEQALEIADALVKSGTMDVIVVDSVAALVPKAELEGDMGQAHIGGQARLMSQALRKLTANLARSKTVLIFINQIRMKIGVMFGNPEVTSGGNALKFYASMRLEIRRVGSLKRGEEVSGNQVVVKVVKNKLAPPFRKVNVDIDFGHGISRTGELVDLGVQTNVLGKSGAWFTYGGNNIAQGRDKAKTYFQENPTVADEVEAKIRAILMKDSNGVVVEDEAAATAAEDEAETVEAESS